MRRFGFVLGFFMGAMLGWVAGILSAPQSGRETMDLIGDKAIELTEKAGQVARRVRSQVRASSTGAGSAETGSL